MLSFTLRRVLSRPGVFSITQMFPTRTILSSQSLAMTLQRNLATTVDDQISGSTADSEPEHGSESKPKSTRRKTRSSTKATGKDKTKKSKVIIRSEDRPPKPPGHAYIQWLADWVRSQPKSEFKEGSKSIVKKGAQMWHTVPEHDKQQYREKYDVLRAEYKKRLEEWREKVDPAVLQEMNRRRAARGMSRIRGSHVGRPLNAFHRYCQHVREEYPRTEEDGHAYFRAWIGRASTQWKAMSDAEKAKYVDAAKVDLAAWREKHRVET